MEEFKMMSAVHFYHQNEIWVLREKLDKKHTTMVYVPKLLSFGKIASFNTSLEQNWLGVSFSAALNVLLMPK